MRTCVLKFKNLKNLIPKAKMLKKLYQVFYARTACFAGRYVGKELFHSFSNSKFLFLLAVRYLHRRAYPTQSLCESKYALRLCLSYLMYLIT